jgi:hypothetical protein
VDDLKLLMDTLGSTVSETCEQMSDDAKTVFGRVDDTNAKIGDLHTASLLEHELLVRKLPKHLLLPQVSKGPSQKTNRLS